MAEPRSTAADERPDGTRIALLLAAAALTIALVGARAENLRGSAGGEWASAVRVESKRQAASTTGQILVYGSTLPNVVGLQRALIRAKAYLSALAPGNLAPADEAALRVLAQVEAASAQSLAPSLAADRAFFRANDLTQPFDLSTRLAAQESRDVQGIETAAGVRAEGDTLSKRSLAEALVVIPAAFAFLLGSLANAIPRRRLAVWWLGVAVLAVALGAAATLEVVHVA